MGTIVRPPDPLGPIEGACGVANQNAIDKAEICLLRNTVRRLIGRIYFWSSVQL